MIEIGRLVVKIAGRDAGKKALIVDVLDDTYVMLDGETRRRKTNIIHIEPLNQVIKIKKNASHDEVAKALKELGIETRETKPKPKTQKPTKKRKTPEQLKVQKEEKRKLRNIFTPKKKDEKAEAKETSLEAKAGLAEAHEQSSAPRGVEKTEAKEEKHAKKEANPKTEKPKKAPAKKKE